MKLDSNLSIRCLAIAAFSGLLIAGCATPGLATQESDESDEAVGSDHEALTAEQCSFFDVNGKVQICHYTGSGSHPYTILKTSEQGCINGHTGHAQDYIAVGDPTCQGGGCLPVTAPCDATLPCCDGLTCQNGTCVDPCAGDPCENGGTCAADGAGYTCTCPAGFTGDNCEINIDECESSPCLHGVCEDGVNAYTCACEPGYSGTNCETPAAASCPCTFFIAPGGTEEACSINAASNNINISDTNGSGNAVFPGGCFNADFNFFSITAEELPACVADLLALDAANGGLCAQCQAQSCPNNCGIEPGGIGNYCL